jgi:esterase/lipase superfamily enzyme
MKLVRKNAVVVILLVALCYILGLVTASYFTHHGAHLGAALTRLLNGKVQPFVVRRNFNQTIYYVTDRKEGPRSNGNATYVSDYAGQVSYGFIKLQIPEDRVAGSQISDDVIRKVESIPYENFIRLLQDQAAKPLVIWIHGYRPSFNLSAIHCAQLAHDLNIDANILTFDWTSSESVLGYTRDLLQVPRSTKHLVNLLEAVSNEVKPRKIIVVAHSLGCRLVCLALQKLNNDPNAKNLKLDHVIFLMPNVDREEFDENFKSELQNLVNRITIYVASDDNVLLLGKLLYNVDSIGLTEHFSPDTELDEIQTFLYYEKQLPDKIDLVDVSFFSKKDFLRKHRVFLERPVVEDLYWLIHDYPAAKRHLLKYSENKSPSGYWVIPP